MSAAIILIFNLQSRGWNYLAVKGEILCWSCHALIQGMGGQIMHIWLCRRCENACLCVWKYLRGQPKISTFSWVYKQYTFSDPLPPHPKVCRPTFLGSKTRVLRRTIFIVQQRKITRFWSVVCDKWYLVGSMYYDLQIIANIVYF